MKYLSIVGMTILACILMFILLSALNGAGLAQYAFWAPKYKAVERRVYQQTPSYVNGNLADMRELRDKIQLENDPQAKATEQAALRDKINHLPENFPVPQDIRSAAY